MWATERSRQKNSRRIRSLDALVRARSGQRTLSSPNLLCCLFALTFNHLHLHLHTHYDMAGHTPKIRECSRAFR